MINLNKSNGSNSRRLDKHRTRYRLRYEALLYRMRLRSKHLPRGYHILIISFYKNKTNKHRKTDWFAYLMLVFLLYLVSPYSFNIVGSFCSRADNVHVHIQKFTTGGRCWGGGGVQLSMKFQLLRSPAFKLQDIVFIMLINVKMTTIVF